MPIVSIKADKYCDVSKIVTAFLLNTCRLPPRLRRDDVQAAVWCGIVAGKHPADDVEVELIPLTTGMLLSSTLNRCCRLSVILT